MSTTAQTGAQDAATGWLVSGLEDDIRPRMFAAADRHESFALATIIAADGGPRPVGAQMVVTAEGSWGFLSGGCIEADVVLNGQEVIRTGRPRTLTYGEGSPFIDIRLPCGGHIDVAIECVNPDDEALAELRRLTAARRASIWQSDGRIRRCFELAGAAVDRTAIVRRCYDPVLRLIVVGTDPFALAIASMGNTLGWEVMLLSPLGPSAEAPFGLHCDRRPLSRSLRELSFDRWTAIAVATHDVALDHEALSTALASPAGYVGVLGSRRKLGERRAALRDAGLSDDAIARLRAPIGLPIDALSPWEVAVAVIGEIIENSRLAEACPVAGDRTTHVAA